MLLIFAVLAFLSAALLLFWYSRRQDQEVSEPPPFSLDPPTARSLFAPSEQDLRLERERTEAIEIARREYRAKAEARAIVDASLLKWREEPNATNAAELLRVSAERGLESDFSRAASEIMRLFRESGIDGLKPDELAALLDSHIHILPEMERNSGAVFWLKQEVAKLSSDNDLIKK
jgi:hypothetical protein